MSEFPQDLKALVRGRLNERIEQRLAGVTRDVYDSLLEELYPNELRWD